MTTLLPLVASSLMAAEARAQAGTTLTPDRQSFMANKDIGDERWTITLTLARIDPPVIASITGNVFRRDGSPPAFVVCQVRPDSEGTLDDPSSTFLLDCKGTDACPTTAQECAQTSWRPLAERLQIEAGFFLPPGGLGDAAAVAAADDASDTADAGDVGPAVPASEPRGGVAGATPRGATLTFDGLNFLVNKDVGTERWSISVNLVPTSTINGGFVERLLSITGNVFQADGSPPAFVYCQPTAGSTGTLDDPSSQFQLACEGTDACEGTALDCAATEWRSLGEVSLAASFFLPPGGRPAAPQSDPELVVIGRTSDPPAIATREFTEGAASASQLGGGGCNEGAPCTVAVVGGCTDVAGSILELPDGTCGCLLEDIPGECIACGTGASGTCGGGCEFPVAGATARGSCLPFVATSSQCACVANEPSGETTTEGCGSVLGADCGAERCCADDPRDGCNTEAGDYDCAGVCVIADCDGASACGICEAGAPFCGDGVVFGTEECDGDDLQGQTCESLGFIGGVLACTATCQFDETGCIPCRQAGQSCTDDGDCCAGSCTANVCAAAATPSPGATATPTPTPEPTASPTPAASATPPPPCQSRAGAPCLGNGFGDCCTPELECVIGPGAPGTMVCRAIAECGNELVESGEECESDNDCAALGPFFVCDDCECIPTS